MLDLQAHSLAICFASALEVKMPSVIIIIITLCPIITGSQITGYT